MHWSCTQVSTVPVGAVLAVSVVQRHIALLAVWVVPEVESDVREVAKDMLLSDHCQGVQDSEFVVGYGTTRRVGLLSPLVDTTPGEGLVLSMMTAPAKRSLYSEDLI